MTTFQHLAVHMVKVQSNYLFHLTLKFLYVDDSFNCFFMKFSIRKFVTLSSCVKSNPIICTVSARAPFNARSAELLTKTEGLYASLKKSPKRKNTRCKI